MTIFTKRKWFMVIIFINISLFLINSTEVKEYKTNEIIQNINLTTIPKNTIKTAQNGSTDYYSTSTYISSHNYSTKLEPNIQRNFTFPDNNGISLLTNNNSCNLDYKHDQQTQFSYMDFELLNSHNTSQEVNLSLEIFTQNLLQEWSESPQIYTGSKQLDRIASIYVLNISDPNDIKFAFPHLIFQNFIEEQIPQIGLGYFTNDQWIIIDIYNEAIRYDGIHLFNSYGKPYSFGNDSGSQYIFSFFVPEDKGFFFEDNDSFEDGSNRNGEFFSQFWPYFIGGFVFIGFIAITAMSREEYRKFLLQWISPRNTPHSLSYEEIFENENRLSIIDCILKEPGIHYNEIRRKCDLHGGQLRWHLDVLLSYGIIKSKQVGQYVLYYPVHKTNPLNEEDLTVVKSERTLEILNYIRYSPGITATKIAQMLKLKRNSVKYHIDKLLERQLIYFKEKGRKKMLYYDKDNELIKNFEEFSDSVVYSPDKMEDIDFS